MSTRVRLAIACPVCLDMSIRSPTYNWSHACDGGELYIDERGMIECADCSHEWHITNSRWGCPSHSGSVNRHQYEYRSASVFATLVAINMAVVSLKGQASAQWFQRLLNHISG